MSTTPTERLTPNFILAQDTEQVIADLTQDDDEDLTTPHAPLRPQRPIRYRLESHLICTDSVQVERAVLRDAVSILRREIGERAVWAVETDDLYDGYGHLGLPIETAAHLLHAFAAHRRKVAPGLDCTEASEALDANPLLDLPFDSLERVLFALSHVLDGYIDGTDSTLGNYQRAVRVVAVMADIIEAMAAFERDVLIPREQEEHARKRSS